MFRQARAAAVWALMSLLLTGCWDIKNIQDINYVTSLGFDLINGQYVAYMQMLDFSSVAKTESGKPTEPAAIWVGQGRGETLVQAVNNLYQTAQTRLFYGQVNAIVFGESLMKKGMNQAKEAVSRYYELRYTPWLFGTKDSIDDLFAVTPFFNFSPIISLLHQPQESYNQQSLIPPIQMREFVSNYREPGNMAALPSLSISKQNWESDGEKKRLLIVDGVYVFQNQEYKGWFGVRNVIGFRWVEPKTVRSPILIRSGGGKPQALVSLEDPKVKIKPHIREDKVTYSVNVKLTGNMSEVLERLPEQDLKRRLEEEVQKEIRQTFEEGIKKGADLLRLEHELYRQNNRAWKQFQSREGVRITPESLQDINVNVKINHAGKLKYWADSAGM